MRANAHVDHALAQFGDTLFHLSRDLALTDPHRANDLLAGPA
jgi:hypothetical protein